MTVHSQRGHTPACMQRLLASWLEAALHPVLDRYFEDLSREQLRLSIFAGDVVLNGLVLRPEAIRAASLPVHVQRGSVRELRIRVPWLHLQTEPIEIIIDTIEIVVALQHESDDDTRPRVRPRVATPATPTADSPAPAHAGGGGDSWMQTLVQRALLNAALRVRNAVVKLVDGRAVASLSLRSLTFDSADARWERGFVELDGSSRTLRKVLELADLTLCLDALDAGSSRVKHFERPLLRAPLMALRVAAHLQPGMRPDGHPTLSLDALSHRMDVSVSEAQLGLLGGLVHAVQAAVLEAARAAARARADARADQLEAATTATATSAIAAANSATSAIAAATTASGAVVAVAELADEAALHAPGAASKASAADGSAWRAPKCSTPRGGHGGACAAVERDGDRSAAPSVMAPAAAATPGVETAAVPAVPAVPPRSRLGRAAGWALSLLFEEEEEGAGQLGSEGSDGAAAAAESAVAEEEGAAEEAEGARPPQEQSGRHK